MTGRLRSPPYPAAAPRQHHGQAGKRRAKCASRQRMSQPAGPERRALSGLPPSGPDGEGQAGGQVPSTRGYLSYAACDLA